MKTRFLFKKGVMFLTVLTILFGMVQPVAASTAETKEKKVSVKFTKTKVSGFKKITDMYTYDKQVVALGTKASGNVIAYSTDGTTFKDLEIDTAVKKEYKSVDFSSIVLNEYIYRISDKVGYSIMGTGTSEDKTTYHFLVSLSKDLKTLKIVPLDDKVLKLNATASNITFEKYFNWDYNTGVIVCTGTYTDKEGKTVKFYEVVKSTTDIAAYKFPESSMDNLDFCGKYLVAYSWSLSMNASNKGEFYYSKDYKSWVKGTTPDAKGAVSWHRSYYQGDAFCISPENYSSDEAYVYYTSDMKKFQNISKPYVIEGRDRNIDFMKYDDTIFATEQSYGEKRRIVVSKKATKAGSKWIKMFDYTAKNAEKFDYNLDYWVAGGIVMVKDGSTNKLFKLSDGKEFSTSLDISKLSFYGDVNKIYYGYYDQQYLMASKDGYIKNYLFKAPEKFNGISYCNSKQGYYVYSDTAIYFVGEATMKAAMK